MYAFKLSIYSFRALRCDIPLDQSGHSNSGKPLWKRCKERCMTKDQRHDSQKIWCQVEVVEKSQECWRHVVCACSEDSPLGWLLGPQDPPRSRGGAIFMKCLTQIRLTWVPLYQEEGWLSGGKMTRDWWSDKLVLGLQPHKQCKCRYIWGRAAIDCWVLV